MLSMRNRIALFDDASLDDALVQHQAHVAPLSILLVDDQPNRIALLNRVLSKAGHDVSVEASGEKALNAIIEWDHDLVVAAQQVSDMSAADLVRRARAIAAGQVSVPIITVIADDTARAIDQSKACGAAAVIAEPIDVRELLGTIQKIFVWPKPMHGGGTSLSLLEDLQADLGRGFVATFVELSMADLKAIIAAAMMAGEEARWAAFRTKCQQVYSVALGIDAQNLASIVDEVRWQHDGMSRPAWAAFVESLNREFELLRTTLCQRGYAIAADG
jgi:CheY-like chemotaxis protein